ncbi:MAG: hypothetical protein AB8G18_03040 [Gammaproteobacteria bacterium]
MVCRFRIESSSVERVSIEALFATMNAVNWRFSVLATVAAFAMVEAAAYERFINVPRDAVTATGSNSVVVQVETLGASKSGQHSGLSFAPEVNDAQFKSVDIRVTAGAKSSQHSHTVAKLFYGKTRSVARGIKTAHVFRSTAWLGRLAQWDLDPTHVSQLFPGPVINHSWVAKPSSADKILRRADYSALSNNVLHVAGVRRRGAGDHLMAGGYNSLVVGGAVQNIQTPYPAINELYGEGRTRPHLVGPYPHASAAAPIVAATVVRLNALAAKKNMVFSTSSRNGSEQLPVELLKAILMASASGNFTYELKGEDLVNAFGTLGVTESGLDKRFGMGMLNIGAAEKLLQSTHYSQAVENQSVSQSAAPSVSGGSGFAYRQLGGETGQSESYTISPQRSGEFAASLSWLADMQNVDGKVDGVVYDFDLAVIEVSSDGASQKTEKIVARSTGRFDTTENIRVKLERGSTYELRVTRKDGVNKPWPYAVAWKM